jgi:hypothetical protein
MPQDEWEKADAAFKAISLEARKARSQGRERDAQRLEKRLPHPYARQKPCLCPRLHAKGAKEEKIENRR